MSRMTRKPLMSSSNGLAAVPGLFVGHADVESSGATVVVCPEGAVGAVDVRGGGPGTRETDLLTPSNSAESVHAVALCGGSAFGLDAAGGVMAELEERGIGFRVFGEDVSDGPVVPIVPAAVIFDLPVGEASSRPTADTGRAATVAALGGAPAAAGNAGAGRGATAGAVKGGFGEAGTVIGQGPGEGRTVAAGLVVNAVGSVFNPADGTLWGATSGVGDEFGELPDPTSDGLAAALERGPGGMKVPPSLNTTIGVVATDAPVTKAQAQRLAMAAHDGLARAVRPSHLPMDGDTIFALAPDGARTGGEGGGVDQMELAVLCATAATCVERAVVHAVLSADTAFGIPAWRDIITGGTA